MSTTPDQSFLAATEDFKRGGWIVTLLGGAGMLARMLLTDQSSPLIVWIRKCFAACIIGVLCYFALHQVVMPQIYKSILMSVAGMASPELMELVISRINKLNHEKSAQPKIAKKPSRKSKRK
jgi:hypothetical protein